MGIKVTQQFASFRTDYSDKMIDDPNDIIERLRKATHGVKYDTIVGRGTSGMLIIPIVARALRKKWLIVRKDEDVRSSHSGQKFLGDLGGRWIFLDDFVSSGETFRKVRDGIKAAVDQATQPRYEWYDANGNYLQEPVRKEVAFETQLVGYFEYEKRADNDGWHLWTEDVRPGFGEMIADTPAGLRENERLAEERSRREAEYAEYSAKRRAEISAPPRFDGTLGNNADCTQGLVGCNCKVVLGRPKESSLVAAMRPNERQLEPQPYLQNTYESLAAKQASLVSQAVEGTLVRDAKEGLEFDNDIEIKSWGDVRIKGDFKVSGL